MEATIQDEFVRGESEKLQIMKFQKRGYGISYVAVI